MEQNCVAGRSKDARGRREDAENCSGREPTATTLNLPATSYGRCIDAVVVVAMSFVWSPLNPQKMIIDCKATVRRHYCDIKRGLREDAQNAINQDAGVTGRRKTAFYRKGVGVLTTTITVLGRRKDASLV
ncbi:hypothetical protein DPMN_131133 [Dreissena polymorpha]|uniref:Uncharacterized protein n=1 Tax=Dreissena polymorpha TaxID=45954 RepID=A0A9D4JZS5_DREPO|nr:hypothetical protein DPMN_131133 [Dreissena polymorpha]